MTRALLTSALLLVSISASAQQGDPVFIQDDGTGVQQQQPQQVQAQPAQQPAQVERGARQSSVYLTVPIWLTDPTDPLSLPASGLSWDPGFGFGIGGRFGWEFGMLVPEVHLGIQTSLSGDPAISRVTNLFFSLGARLQFVNPSRFLPFVAVAFRGNFWGSVDERGARDTTYSFNPAASGGAGLAVELSRTIGLEAAVDVVANFPLGEDALFENVDVMLIPRLGGTLYF